MQLAQLNKLIRARLPIWIRDKIVSDHGELLMSRHVRPFQSSLRHSFKSSKYKYALIHFLYPIDEENWRFKACFSMNDN